MGQRVVQQPRPIAGGIPDNLVLASLLASRVHVRLDSRPKCIGNAGRISSQSGQDYHTSRMHVHLDSRPKRTENAG